MRLSEAEWQLMNALWQGYPATAREIAGRLPAGVSWAYTTIKTMLTRLVSKRAVSEHKRGNASFYEPLLSRDAARGNALSALVDQAFGGAVAPLVHFLVEERRLSRRERQELLDILRAEGMDGSQGGHDA